MHDSSFLPEILLTSKFCKPLMRSNLIILGSKCKELVRISEEGI